MIHDDLYFKSFYEGLKPDPNFNVSECADNHRILTSVSSAEPGPWRTDRTPYLKEIMAVSYTHLTLPTILLV